MSRVLLGLVLLCVLLTVSVSASGQRQHQRVAHKNAKSSVPQPRHPAHANAPAVATMTINAAQPKLDVSPLLFGAFYEELNHAGYGGLHAELLQNGLFQQNSTAPWSASGAGCSMELDSDDPLSANNPNSLLLTSGTAAPCSLSNAGYFGIAVQPDTVYNISFFAKLPAQAYPRRRHTHGHAAAAMAVTVGFQAKNGAPVYAQAVVTVSGSTWKQYAVQLRVPDTVTLDPTGAFFLSVPAATTVSLHVVRVMGAAGWQGLPLRTDLAQLIADMQPHVLRFPGGCYVEGHQRAGAWRWKKTIGAIQDRPGHPGFWGYWSPDHLGAFEYLLFAEKMNAEPIFVVNAGMSFEGQDVPLSEMGEFVQDALDAIEFCNGDSSTTWGAVRASLGHPEPFNLQYMAIGNEEDKLMTDYAQRYPLFYDAIKQRYPDFNVIATTPRVLQYGSAFDLYDYHLYSTPVSVANAMGTFDNANRSQLVFASEYAVSGGSNDTVNYYTLVAALAEAQYMIGLEHNSDVVIMAAYAPLLVNYYDQNWSPDAIMFNTYQVFGSPSYYQQVLYSSHTGCSLLPSSVAVSANIVVNPAVAAIHNSLVLSATSRPLPSSSSSFSSFDCARPAPSQPQQLVVKLVYWGTADLTATFNVTLPSSALTLQTRAELDSLANASLWAANSLSDPKHVVPQHSTQAISPVVTGTVASFTIVLPAQSSSVLTLTLL